MRNSFAISLILTLAVSDVVAIVRLERNKTLLDEARRMLAPVSSTSAPPLFGYTLGPDELLGGPINLSTRPDLLTTVRYPEGDHSTLIFVNRDGCPYCEQNVEGWRWLAEEARRRDAHVKVVVVDLFRTRQHDEISAAIRPDARIIPNPETILSHHFYQAPITIAVSPDRRYRVVEMGVLDHNKMVKFIGALR